MRASMWITVALLVAAVIAFGRLLLERQESAALRAEISVLRQDEQRFAQLRAERERLIAGKISDAELARLRNDRAALVRLRAEIDKLESNADRMAKTVAEPAAKSPENLLILSIASDGGLTLEDSPIDLNNLRQQIAKRVGKTEWVEINLRVAATKTSLEVVKSTMESISELGKELGVKLSFRLDSGTR